MNAFLWERRPRHDRASQTTAHRPEGGAPTGIAVLKKTVHFKLHRAGSILRGLLLAQAFGNGPNNASRLALIFSSILPL